jgi:hypothetical protein
MLNYIILYYPAILQYTILLYRGAAQGEEACVVPSGRDCGALLHRGAALLAVTTMTVVAGKCTLA